MRERLGEDGAGNSFVAVGNLRVTYLPQSKWDPDAPGLRIQAYRDADTNALHWGAELSLGEANGYELIAAIALLLGNAGR